VSFHKSIRGALHHLLLEISRRHQAMPKSHLLP